MSRRLILRAGLRAAGVALAVSVPVAASADPGTSCTETCVPPALVQKAGCADTACTNAACATGAHGTSCTATAIPNCTTSAATNSQTGLATGPATGAAQATPGSNPFEFAAQPGTPSGAPLDGQPVIQSAASDPTADPAAETASFPATEPATETASFPATEPTAEAVSFPAAEPIIQPATPPAGAQPAGFTTGAADASGIEQPADFTLPTKADEADTRAHRIASRMGTGFRGFCPVVLRDKRELADAQTEIFSVYESRTYRFSSAEAKAQFDADPAQYAPILGGLDVVTLAETGTEEEGSLAHAHWFRDRLFFFTSESNATRFFNDPTKYVSE